MNIIRIVFLGDIMGRPGRRAVYTFWEKLKSIYKPDFIIANGENAAGGFGLTLEKAKELKEIGIDVITTGNHIWDKKEFVRHIDTIEYVLRPANYPPGVPGRGWGIWNLKDVPIAVINLQGRVFMDPIDCPFRKVDEILNNYLTGIKVIIVDFHAEATAEKICMGYYLKKRVSAVLGTHTHVQTADERIIENYTGYITDVGMCGAVDSSIGVEVKEATERLIYQVPIKFNVASGKTQLNGVFLEIEKETGRCLKIERINWKEGNGGN
ncbi:MAG: TIGR00282 family metallophosphoesterase [Thermosulfidibacteraceae bacterium]